MRRGRPHSLRPLSILPYFVLGCAAHTLVPNRAPDLRPPAPETIAAAPAPEPMGWNTQRSAGLGFRNRPHATVRIPLSGPVEALTSDGARVFVLAGGTVAMVESNAVGWVLPLEATALSYLPSSSGGALWASCERELLQLDPTDGRVLRRVPAGGALTSSAKPSSADELAWMTLDGTIHTTAGWTADGLTSASGSVAVTASTSTPATVYGASLDGAMLAADSAGERWRTALPGPAVGAPMIGPDGVFVAVAGLHEPGGIIAVHADGTPFWRARAAQTPSLPPAMGPDGDGGWNVYLADRNGKLSAFQQSSGQERWTVEVGGAISAMAVLEDLVLIGAADGVLYAAESADGGVRWRAEVGTITVPPVTVGAKLWLGLAEGALVTLEE
jgi:outer membrane protein assembly factor BamB